MALSTRKTPIIGYTVAESERPFKQQWHRAFRRLSRVRTQKSAIEEDTVHPIANEVRGIWDGDKDGKQFLRVVDLKLMK